MSEESENTDAPKPEELESLFGSFDLTPDWAKGKPGVTQSEPTTRSKGGGRGRDGGSRPRAPKSSRPNMQGVRVKPRRTPSEGGGHGGGHGGGGHGGGGDSRDYNARGPRGEGGRGGQRYQERAPRVPVHVDFIPEKKRLSKVVKVIRQSHRAFPLKVVAGKFMEKASFISMKYTVKDNAGPEAADFYLYVCTANGMVFSDQQACEQYVLDHGMGATYEREDREVAPPNGNFVCVGRHSRSGKLIGPPNWHGYQARLETLRNELAENMPMDAFMRQIDMVHDEEQIEAWKKDVSVQSFYRKKLEEKEAEAGDQKSEGGGQVEAKAGDQKSESGDQEEAVVAEEVAGDQANPSDQTDPAATEAPVADAPVEEAPVEEAAAEEVPVVDERPYEWTRDQAEADFREHHLPKLIKKTKRAIMPGYLFDKMTDPSLLSLTRFHLNREHDRPNSIIFALRPAFKHMRLLVFRHQGELMVSGIAQHPLPDDMKVVEEIRHILDYVAANPGCNTQVALKAVAKQDDEVPAELVSHFRWLIEKGHLVEMHDDTLQLPHASGKK